MGALITTVRALLARHRFAKAYSPWDRQIEAARAKHAPVRPIMEAKQRAIHRALAGSR